MDEDGDGGSGRLDAVSRERIEVIRAYERGELREPEASERLGLGRTQFYRLLRSWRSHHDPLKLAKLGSNGPVPRVTETQREAIRKAVADTPGDHPLDAIVRLAVGRLAAAGGRVPSRGTIRRIASGFRPAPSHEKPERSELVLAPCAVDVAATDGMGPPFMPIVLFATTGDHPLDAMVLRERPEAADVAGLLARVFAAAARGDLDAETRVLLAAEEVRIRIDMDDGAEWRALASALGEAGLVLESAIARPPSGLLASSLLGPIVEGLAMLPRKTRLASSDRRPGPGRRTRSPASIEAWLIGDRPGTGDVPDAERETLRRRSHAAEACAADGGRRQARGDRASLAPEA
jgi:hypothetical protein